MPIYFWNDPDNERYQSSYFEHYAGAWRHGDWIKITDRNSIVIYGRSDATLNRDGVRIGTSEVYSAVESLPEVSDSLVVCLELPHGRFFMPLFVVLSNNNGEPEQLTEEITQRIRQTLRTKYSPRHVPDAIYQVAEIPYTISGKKVEAPVKKLLMGALPQNVTNPDTFRNPAALNEFVRFAELFEPENLP